MTPPHSFASYQTVLNKTDLNIILKLSGHALVDINMQWKTILLGLFAIALASCSSEPAQTSFPAMETPPEAQNSTFSLRLEFSSCENVTGDLSNSSSQAFQGRVNLTKIQLTPVFENAFPSFLQLTRIHFSVNMDSGNASEDGSGDEFGSGSGNDSGDGSGIESGDGSGIESGDGSGIESGDGSGSGSEEGSGEASGGGSADGSGDGSGIESGDGSGIESGDGSGIESGDGSGIGSGDGSGIESGDGSGIGSGDGSGIGSESGSGDGEEEQLFSSQTNVTNVLKRFITTIADLVFSFSVPSTIQVEETLKNEINNGTVTIPIVLSSISVTTLASINANNNNCSIYKNRAQRTRDEIEPICRRAFLFFIRLIVIRFRPGSIVTDVMLVYNSSGVVPNTTEVQTTLQQGVENGNVTIPINVSSISVTPVQNTDPTVASTREMEATSVTTNPASTIPTTTTAASTNVMTASAFVNTTSTLAPVSTVTVPGLTTAAATTTAESTVILLLEFSSDEEFTPGLSEPTSQAFRNRDSLTKTQLEPVFRRAFTTFIQFIVFRFRNGSIVTEGGVIFRNLGSVPNTDQLVRVLIQAVENGDVTIPINITSISANSPSSSGVSPVPPPVFSCFLLAWCSLLLAKMLSVS
ncbi:hypothetical protein COCON_G00105970 [Conger conger]|uniref:SEA domain-containing protein n=1 Tax=Conger conger TaxID=82655 RepID=A0A9Q1HYZ0_CONCO|nr:hypothetical protein COCON_G00105970 [Conger conger]